MTILKNFLLGSAIVTFLLNGNAKLGESKKYNANRTNPNYIEYNLDKKNISRQEYISQNLFDNQKLIPEKEELISPVKIKPLLDTDPDDKPTDTPNTKKEIKKKKKNLEKKFVQILPPNMRVGCEFEMNQTLADYSDSYAFYRTDQNGGGSLNLGAGSPKLTDNESFQLLEIMDNIEDENFREINSNGEFKDTFKTLSENQKIVLSTLIAHQLYDKYYSKSENKSEYYVCRQISSDLEKLLNEGGIRAAAATTRNYTGRGHAYVIAKTKNGTAIIDGSSLLTTQTKNIEKALEAYQRSMGQFLFQSLFYENDKLKYNLITKEGKHYLDFIGYDESSAPLRDYLLNKNTSDMDVVFNIENGRLNSVEMDSFNFSLNKGFSSSIQPNNNGDYINYAGINAFGVFTKIGEFSSPANKMILVQAGGKGTFSIPNIIKVTPSISYVYGKMSDTADEEINVNNIANGLEMGLIISTDKKKGFNFSSRVSRHMINTESHTLFFNTTFGMGISYTIPTKYLDFTPYVALQGVVQMGSLDEHEEDTFMFDELRAGINFNAKFPNDISFSIEPYYTKKNWEDKFSLDTTFNSKYAGLNTGFYISKSNYDFAPDRIGFHVGGTIYINPVGFNIDGGLDIKKYEDEFTYEPTLSFEGILKF